MTTVQISSQAYEVLLQQARATQRSLTEVASQIIMMATMASGHPYIECRENVLGGKPVIKSTRIPVWQIVERFKLGDSVDDLLNAYQHLSAAAIYDVISYYYDHRQDIDRQIEDNQLETVLDRHKAIMDDQGRIRFQDLPVQE